MADTMATERGLAAAGRSEAGAHRCPVWVGPMLLNPLRRLLENPERMLAGRVREGDIALDIGCGMGFFALPLARAVGEGGRVVCVDVEPRMLSALVDRAARAGLARRIEARRCESGSLPLEDLAERVDVAVIVHVVHEVPDAAGLFRQLWRAMKPGGWVLFSEPRFHVSRDAFDRSLGTAGAAGFEVDGDTPAGRGLARLLRKA